jgi:hypothetical protein
MGAADNGGYGVLNVNGTIERAHRLSHSLFIGPIGDLFCCHKCDTPLCANPDHLFLGTAHDNSLDMARGEISYHKLTKQQVIQIRADYETGKCTFKSLGKQYGVDHTAIYKIVHRKRWTHI